MRIITDASRDEIAANVGSVAIGNRRFHLATYPAPGEPGLIIAEAPDWAAGIVTAALRKIDAWFDRVAPQGRIPRGKPVVSYAGASSVRNQNQRKIDKATRRDREIRRAMKAA